ncbi:MAG: GDSL-type esterase/lipase family protein [Cyanobacteria bacterium P01_F01_bin.150]
MSELCTLAASVVLQSSASAPEFSSLPEDADAILVKLPQNGQPSVGCNGHRAIAPAITPEVGTKAWPIEKVEFSQAKVDSGEQPSTIQLVPTSILESQTSERLQLFKTVDGAKGYSPRPGDSENFSPVPLSRPLTTDGIKPRNHRLLNPQAYPNGVVPETNLSQPNTNQANSTVEPQADSVQIVDSLEIHSTPSIPARWPSLLYPHPQTESTPQATLPFIPEPNLSSGLNRPLQPLTIPPSRVRPQSGRQLYQQRWAALRAGKTYTRLPSDSFEAQWKNARHNPTYEDWLYLLAQEARSMAVGQGDNALTVIVGDSLSLWMPTEFLPQHRFWLNQSISGETAAAMVKRLHMFDQANPDTIHVMAGINDLKNGASDADVLGSLQTMMRQLRYKHPRAEVIIHSILPTRLPHLPSDRIHSINQQLANIALQEGTTFSNLQEYFSDTEGHLRQDLTTDGLHLNYRGYTMWRTAMVSGGAEHPH